MYILLLLIGLKLGMGPAYWIIWGLSLLIHAANEYNRA